MGVSIHKNSLFRLWAPLNKQVQDKGLSSEMLLGAASCLAQHPDHCRSLQFANMNSPSPPGSGYQMKPLWSVVSTLPHHHWPGDLTQKCKGESLRVRKTQTLNLQSSLWVQPCYKQLCAQMIADTCSPTANSSSGHAFSPTPKCICPCLQRHPGRMIFLGPRGGNWGILLVH